MQTEANALHCSNPVQDWETYSLRGVVVLSSSMPATACVVCCWFAARS